MGVFHGNFDKSKELGWRELSGATLGGGDIDSHVGMLTVIRLLKQDPA